MLINPGSARGGFEIFFQGCGFFIFFQPDGGFYFPGAIFGGVFGLAVIMGGKAGFEVGSEADVGSVGVTQTLEKIDMHRAPPEVAGSEDRVRVRLCVFKGEKAGTFV
jgi:hypothetical protein